MGIKITSVQEALENNGLKILVHGMAGSGKTVLCATTGASTLIVSAESGLLSIAGAPDYIKTTVVKTINELEEVYDYVEENLSQFEWICIDSISEIAEVLLADEKRNSKDPRQAYGNLSDRMLGILRSFRDLPNMNVVMSCKQQLVTDSEANTSRFVPLLPGKALTNSIPYLFDEVFVLRVEKDEEGDDYRTIQTGRDRNYEAKDRSGLLDMFEEPSIKRIAAKIRGGHADEKAEHSDEEKQLINEASGGIDSVEDGQSERTKGFYQETNENDGAPEETGDTGLTTKEASEAKELLDEKDAVGETENGKEADKNGELVIENDSDKIMYLYHNASDAILKLEVGESINDDGSIDIVDYKTYMGHKKRLKAEKK